MFNFKKARQHAEYDKIVKKAAKNSEKIKKLNDDFNDMFTVLTASTEKMLQTRY